MNWLNIISITFLLCVYPALELRKQDAPKPAVAEEAKEYLESTEFNNKNDIKFIFASAKTFKPKKSKEIL